MMVPFETPYADDLRAAVAALYDAFGRGHVSRQLEVCTCPVCMDEATRQRIIATPNDALWIDDIRAYSNSAHGVPQQISDLRLLLPRYLEWMACDEMVDDIGVGTELLRFGQAIAQDSAFYTPAQRTSLEDWARAALWHYACAEARELDNFHSHVDLMETLIVGGWDAAWICDEMNRIFAHSAIGLPALASFLRRSHRDLRTKREHPRLNWYGLTYVSDETRHVLAEWLNGAPLRNVLTDLASDPGAAADDQTYARLLLHLQGKFTADSFPLQERPASTAS